MDRRTALQTGTVLPFPGMRCLVERVIGRGSNAIVYEGHYPDALNPALDHRILIKELFPYTEEHVLWRGEDQSLRMDEKGREAWDLHRLSFERGNEIHLQLLARHPDQIGGNLNTFALNGTLYTLLDYTGGRSLDQELALSSPPDLRGTVRRLSQLLTVLDTFHSLGYLHLDISTDNVLLIGQGEQERVMLIDYNSVHTQDELSRGEAIYFSAKEGFTPPEIRTGLLSAIAPCTDLFSVTSVFYTCLTGRPPSFIQLNRKSPPDAQDSPLLQGIPATAREQIRKILYRGLHVLPDKRYASCRDMLRDCRELLDRLDGIGVTHAALWEAGRRSVQRLIQQNPSLGYVRQDRSLYPLRIQADAATPMPLADFMRDVTGDTGQSTLLLGEGGIGKSTALLRTVLAAPGQYTAAGTAVMYLPLLGWKQGQHVSILDRILMELRFDAHTQTMDAARHALLQLLSHAIRRRDGSRAVLLLLLDGLNETGSASPAWIEEIVRLSALPGLRIVVTSRTAPEGLPLCRASMIRLSENDVLDALGRHGLLLPESEELRQLLSIPMMLSLYISTAGEANGQLLCQTQKELLAHYLAALSTSGSGEADSARRWQTDVAVHLVLPAIAQEIARQDQPLTDSQLLKTVSRYHRMLRTKALSRAFPAWIGHSSEILGAHADSSEAWYGLIVQTILWKRLGLLIRDENGCYHVLHQILQEYLVGAAQINRQRLHTRQRQLARMTLLMLLLLSVVSLCTYEFFIKPKPYDENLSRIVLDNACAQYQHGTKEYQLMMNLLDERTTPSDIDSAMDSLSSCSTSPARTAAIALQDMQEGSGKVIPISHLPFDFQNCAALFALPEKNAAAYATYMRAYALLLSGETKASTSLDVFREKLTALLRADASILWLLGQAVCEPHLAFLNQTQQAVYSLNEPALLSAQEPYAADMTQGLPYALSQAYDRQRAALRELNTLAIMADPNL